MRIAIFLFLLLVGFAHANSKPNFVLIIADDVSPQDIGVFGSENAKTPNIDGSIPKVVEWWEKKRAKRIKNVLQCPMC